MRALGFCLTLASTTILFVRGQVTYVVQDQCRQIVPSWDEIITAQLPLIAADVLIALDSETDSDFHRVVKQTFKIDRQDDRWARVKGLLLSRDDSFRIDAF
jgi:hypothetical protein